MRESALERRLVREVKRRGGQADKFTVPGKRGMPDRIILLPGARTVFVEMKAPGESLRPLQAKRAKDLRAMDFPVYCIDSIKGINDFIAEVFPS